MWRPRMRLAAAPGRLARPAPPGNDDPCVEEDRRTILEGLPDNGEHGPGPKIATVERRRGERPVAGNARRLTARASGLPDVRKKPGLPGLRKSIAGRARPGCAMIARRSWRPASIERGVCASVTSAFTRVLRERVWHAETDASHASERHRRSATLSWGAKKRIERIGKGE